MITKVLAAKKGMFRSPVRSTPLFFVCMLVGGEQQPDGGYTPNGSNIVCTSSIITVCEEQ